MAAPSKKDPTVTETSVSGSSSSSSITSKESQAQVYHTPHKARFAGATVVHSPAGLGPTARTLDMIPAAFNSYHPQTQPADIGFGYMPEFEWNAGIEMPVTPFTPFSTIKNKFANTPGAHSRMTLGAESVLSPTFKEERALEKSEKETEKQQAQDLKVKTRVRLAKLLLRYTNLTCSLIVLSLLSTTFSIFNATRALPLRSSLSPWSPHTAIWPQVTLLAIACVSLLISVIIIYRNWRGRNNRSPEKAVVYYTVFSIAFFTANIIMWLAGLLILHLSRQNGNGQDIWGWACKSGMRKEIFKDQVAYDVVCRMQQWSLVCAAIEIVVEILTISVYGIIFYRYYTRKRLQKAMSSRDQARSDLYLAHLRLQSAPSSPGYLTRQASFRAQKQTDIKGQTVVVGQTADAYANPFMTPAPFTAQPLLGGFDRTVEENEGEIAGEPGHAQMVSAPGPETTYAAPQAKPFVLSAAPPSRKGRASAHASPQPQAGPSTAASPNRSHFSPGLGSDEGLPRRSAPTSQQHNSPISFSPTTTFPSQQRTKLPPPPLPIQSTFPPFVAEVDPTTEYSRPASMVWPPSPNYNHVQMPAAPGELAYECVPIPGAYGVVNP